MEIQMNDSVFVAKVKENQKGLSSFVKEIEEVSSIDSHFTHTVKQSGQKIRRDVFVYNNCIYPWNGIWINCVIRIDKSIDDKETTTHYYISNEQNNAEGFLKKILDEWSVETMHFYKDTALKEDKCKVNKGAFSLSILRSFVINILHLNKVKNIGRKIVKTTYELTEALTLLKMTRVKYGLIK
jgi:hypothetical protein